MFEDFLKPKSKKESEVQTPINSVQEEKPGFINAYQFIKDFTAGKQAFVENQLQSSRVLKKQNVQIRT